ncbi:MAG: hypothetical protein R3E10_02065 [Gemmatimonadota bacterium]
MIRAVWHRAAPGALALWLVVGGAPAPLVAQSGAPALVARCSGGDAGLAPACGDAVLGAMGLGLGSSLLMSGGAVVPVPPNTLGRRVPQGGPRASLSLRLLAATVSTVRMGEGAQPAAPLEETGWGFRAAVAAGVFDGLRPIPSVGGLFSLDLFATVDHLGVASAAVREGGWAWGGGARLGLLRESFTTPGVAVDLATSRTGKLRLQSGATDPVTVGVRAHSLRVSVGKDLLGVGAVGGVGRDWSRMDVELQLPGAQPAQGSIDTSRDVAFLGATLNYLVAQLSAEVGWAGGINPPGVPSTIINPSRERLFGSFAVRLIY